MKQQITVQKASLLLRTKGIVTDKPIKGTELEYLKMRGNVILADESAQLFAEQDRFGKFVYSMLEGVPADMPTGEMADTEDGKTKIHQTPAGTEIMLAFEQMEHLVENYGELDDDEEEDDDDDDDDDGLPPRKRVIKKYAKEKKKPVVLTPKVFFQFINSKLTVVEQQNVRERLNKLKGMMISADSLGQVGLYEEMALQFASIAREQELAVIGCNKRLPESVVKLVMHSIQGRVVRYCKFEEFPRIVPAEIAVRIKQVQDAKVFDSFHILFVDYVGEEFKSTHQKIKEKDPILFGKLQNQPNTLYFIIDWIDEHCDLTLDKIIETIQLNDPTFKLDEVPEVDYEYIKKTVEEIEKRALRLKRTDPRTYRRLMQEQREEEEARREATEEEEAAAAIRDTETVAEPTPAKSWFHRFMDAAGNFLPFKK